MLLCIPKGIQIVLFELHMCQIKVINSSNTLRVATNFFTLEKCANVMIFFDGLFAIVLLQ